MSEVFVCYLFNRPANKSMSKVTNKKALKMVIPCEDINKKQTSRQVLILFVVLTLLVRIPSSNRIAVKINAKFYF